MQPGQTVTPGSAGQPSEQPPTPPQTQEITQPVPTAVSPTPQPIPAEQPSAPAPAIHETTQSSDDSVDSAVSWTASEYIAHNKGQSWFAIFGLGLFVVIGLIYLLTRDILASVLVGVAGLSFGIFAGRAPRVLEYSVHPGGIDIGPRSHQYSEFKSFTGSDIGPIPSILLLPLKRFVPPITIYYDPKQGDDIFDTLAQYLPYEDREPDLVERLMNHVRF